MVVVAQGICAMGFTSFSHIKSANFVKVRKYSNATITYLIHILSRELARVASLQVYMETL